MITEFPEFFGAVHAVLRRCTSQAVYDKAVAAFARYRDELRAAGEAIDSNPSKGNVAAGLTTLAQKSLGAVLKGGSGPVVECLDYGEPAQPRQGGLALCYGPGNDLTAITDIGDGRCHAHSLDGPNWERQLEPTSRRRSSLPIRIPHENTPDGAISTPVNF